MTHTNDHEIKVGSTTKALKLIRDDKKSALYNVFEEIPNYQQPLLFTQTDWIGGHGQYDFEQPDVYFEGQSIDTTQEGRLCLGPLIYTVGIDGSTLGANPVCFVWFSAISKWLVATATKVFWYDDTNFVEKEEFAGEVITSMVVINDILYVCLGTSTKYYYSADAVTFTQTDLDDGYAEQIFAAPNAAATATVLWKYKTANDLRNTTDGRTVAGGGVQWASTAVIGDSSADITQIFLVNDALMIGKEDNLYHYDSDGGLHPLLTDLRHNRSTNNFKYVVDWQSAVYFSLGRGMAEVTSYSAFEPMGPLHKIDNIGKIGDCVGLASSKDWMFIAKDEGTNTIIYKGREVRVGGQARESGLRWEWCPWVFLGANACATMKVCQHSATDRRVWFGYGNNAGYAILSDNPTADSAARFAAAGWIRMSYVIGTNRYWDKLWQSIVTETKGCTANLTVQPMYRKDAETSATNLTAAITTNGTVKTNLTAALTSNRIQFELHLATNSSTTTPEVLFFEARGVEKPETVRIHEAVYAIGDEPSKRAETIRTFLRGGRTSTSLIRFADLRYGETTGGTAGTDFVYVVVDPGYPQEIEIVHTKGGQPELGIKVRFREVSFT